MLLEGVGSDRLTSGKSINNDPFAQRRAFEILAPLTYNLNSNTTCYFDIAIRMYISRLKRSQEHNHDSIIDCVVIL